MRLSRVGRRETATRSFATTYHKDWAGYAELERGGRSPLRWIRFIWKARRLDAMMVSGATGADAFYDDLVLSAICVRLFPRLRVVLAECWWEPGSRAINRLFKITSPPAVDAPSRFALEGLIARFLHSLDHPRLHYVVNGDSERKVFSDRWRIPLERIHFVPYWATADERQGVALEPADVDVFAGGDSLRDYRTLLAAASEVNGTIVIATRLPGPEMVPDNVIYGPLDPETYARYAASARVVVVCLREDAPRSSGHQNYLNAMFDGVPVVVTESLGVRDHIPDGETGVIVPHDPDRLAAAINEALSDSEAVRARVKAGQEAAHTSFTANSYDLALRALVEQA